MPANFNHQEKKALLAIVKFIIDADGVISEEEAERCGKLAKEKGFEDFSAVFAEVDREVKTIDDVLVLAAKVKDTAHEQDILGIAIDIAEADANLIEAEDSFIKRLAELWGIPLNSL